MHTLSEQPLQVCTSTSQAILNSEINQHLSELNDWKLATDNNVKQILKSYKFKNFAAALAFTNKVGELAEAENHHPKLCIEWGRVTISWWTHTVNGLFINDFIMAARCDAVYTKELT